MHFGGARLCAFNTIINLFVCGTSKRYEKHRKLGTLTIYTVKSDNVCKMNHYNANTSSSTEYCLYLS